MILEGARTHGYPTERWTSNIEECLLKYTQKERLSGEKWSKRLAKQKRGRKMIL